MKMLDEYFGKVIVFLISILKKISRQKTAGNSTSENILFVKFWGIGSIVLTTPALNKVKSVYPGSKIFFLTLKSNLEICNEITLIDEIVTIDISNPFVFISDVFRKILILRKFNFDIIFDFEFYTYFSAIIANCLKSCSGIGFDNLKNNRNVLFSNTIFFNDRIHTKENFMNLVNADERVGLFSDYSSRFPELVTLNLYKNGEPKILVNPNASKLAFERRLPEKYFIDIINHFSKNYKIKIILTGSENESKYVRQIYENINDITSVKNLCGKTNLRELISLIASSQCLITNDSGPLHIASAVNTPVIAFFGPESPQRYGPLSDKKLVFYQNLVCSPCMSVSNSKTVNCIFDSPKCMEQFELNEVIKRIDSFIREIISLKGNQKTQWSAGI
jgi:lipopolysaccharide heptosyltransferase II